MKDSIFRSFGMVTRIAHRYMGNQLEAYGLSKGQPRVLRLLRHHSSMTQKDLLTHMDIRPATLTRMLQRMEKNKLITRSPSKKDQRVMEITITQEGIKAQEDAERVLFAMESELSALLTAEEKETLHRIMHKLYNYFKSKDQGGCQ